MNGRTSLINVRDVIGDYKYKMCETIRRLKLIKGWMLMMLSINQDYVKLITEVSSIKLLRKIYFYDEDKVL